jgi:EAL and modified HD-GYP domain-containing signal transduction protein
VGSIVDVVSEAGLEPPPGVAGQGIDAIEAYLGRQPIVDRDGRLVAYELLYRRPDSEASSTCATSDVVASLLNCVEFAESLGRFRGSINVSTDFLLSDMVEILTPASVVFEIPENVRATPELMARIVALRSRGFSFALDDFTAATLDNTPLLNVVDYIKVDVRAVPERSLGPLVRDLRSFPAKLVAEKIGDAAAYSRCVELGFDLFQGFHFARPQALAGRRADPQRMQVLRLLQLVMSDAEQSRLEEEFKRQPALTINLLRLVNSAAAGLRMRTASVRDALVRIGRRPLAMWLELLIYGVGGSIESSALFRTAAVRARLMELIAGRMPEGGAQQSERAFLVGVLSLMPVVLDMTPEALAEELDLDESVGDALIAFIGPLGDLLALVQCYEGGGCDALAAWAADPRWPPANEIARFEVDAQAWAGNLVDDERQ